MPSQQGVEMRTQPIASRRRLAMLIGQHQALPVAAIDDPCALVAVRRPQRGILAYALAGAAVARRAILRRQADHLATRSSEERRVGKACVRTCSSRWPQSHYKTKRNNSNQMMP